MVVPVKAVSEATREREAFRYEPLLLSDYQFSRDGSLPRRSEQWATSDAVLTALAQLGTYRTQTDRAFVSLFDTSHQYVVAEATGSTRIVPILAADSSLNLCGSAIPRQQGTCDHVLYLPNPESAQGPELPISFVPNLGTDPRFCKRPYCQFGEKGQFYAGVPLRTPRGIDIGAYCVMASTVPESWNEQCEQDLRDISHAIIEHLELKRSQKQARRHERVNRGLGSFVESKATLSGWQSGTNTEAFGNDATQEGALNSRQQDIENQRRQDGEATGRVLARWGQSRSSSPDRMRLEGDTTSKEGAKASTIEDNPEQKETLIWETYARAANIIREAFEVEGSIFVNASLTYPSQSHRSRPVSAETKQDASQTSSTSSSDENTAATQAKASGSSCEVLSISTTEVSSINDPGYVHNADSKIPERFLAKLLRRYPTGKIWNFDSIGDLHSSDSSEEDVLPLGSVPDSHAPSGTDSAADGNVKPQLRQQKGRLRAQSQEGSQLRHAFPNARSIAFFPLWDQKRERWLAGGFMYTLAPTRLFSVQEDLSFLIAFGKLMVAEALRIETLQADKAKSDVLGSLSHELRSPLHGAILGTELLNDTELSVFQGSATHTIETCCRTMLDTIEHLLDYAKVNSFAAKQDEESSTSSPARRRRSKTEQFGKKLLYKHTQIDSLVEEVVESVFLGFNYQRVSVQQVTRQERSGLTDAMRNVSVSSGAETTSLPTVGGQPGPGVQPGNVTVFISVDPACDWMFHTQPGALRRIVMNLFGNALKYTTKGIIRVALTQEPHPRSTAERLVKFTVYDTGKGISEEYLRHKLFKSFSQEDELSPGTGLGLSLVKMITSQLRGQITVDSKVGVGTRVTVSLPLEQSRSSNEPVEMSSADQAFQKQRRDLAGLRVRIMGFEALESMHLQSAIEEICAQWLGLHIIQDKSAAIPDISLWWHDSLPRSVQAISQLARTPNVVVCPDAVVAHRTLTAFQHSGQAEGFDFISQPIGPRAWARALFDAYRQWVGLSKALPVTRPPGPVRSHSLSADRSKPEAMSSAGISPQVNQSQLQQPITYEGASPEGPNVTVPDSTEPDLERITSRFLLVDDNHINLKVLSAYMGKLGHKYQTAVNGKEAVDSHQEDAGQFIGILMDISMPVMDGLEATRQIRAHERRNKLKTVPIIVLTGLASHSVQQDARESGVDVFLTKPVSMKALDEALKSVGTERQVKK